MHHKKDSLREIIAYNLKFYMLIKGMSQAELSRNTDIPAKSISRILAAEQNEIIDGFEAMAKALKEEPQYFVIKDGYKHSRTKDPEGNLIEERKYSGYEPLSEIDKKKMRIFHEILICEDKDRLTDLKHIMSSALKK